MAREAGYGDALADLHAPALERFAALVAAAEREACAKLFDGEVWAYDYREIAAAIRARGNDAA
jgi:hypothetical protein